MAKNPGWVHILAALVGDAFAQSHTPLNILGSFKKAGIYPFNPEEVHVSETTCSFKGKEQAERERTG